MAVQKFAVAVPGALEVPESRAAQIRRLQELTRKLASSHVLALENALAEVGKVAKEITEGGDVYPSGIRQLAERLAEDAPWNIQTLEAIRGRTLQTVERSDAPASKPINVSTLHPTA